MKGIFWQKFISLNLMIVMHLNLIIRICQKIPFKLWLTHIQITIDILENSDYSFVKQYGRFGTIISNLSQYINKDTNINIFKKITIIRFNNKYAILYMNNKVFVVELS